MSETTPNPENPTPPAPSPEGTMAAVLPLRDIVVFPHMIVPLFVGREKSVRALEEVMNEEKQILLLTQKNAGEDDPAPDGLYRLGTLATVLQLLKLPDQTVRVLVEGKARARVTGFNSRSDFFQATVEKVGEEAASAQESEALMRTVKANFEQYIKLNKKIPSETLAAVAQIEDPAKLADLMTRIPEEDLRGFIRDYLQSCGATLARLPGLAAGGDLTALAQSAHDLKGLSATFGARRLMACIEALERACRNQDGNGARELVERAQRIFGETETATRAWISLDRVETRP